MTFELRVASVALAAFAVASLAGAILVPWLAARLRAADAGDRARRLARIRWLPGAAAAAAGVVALTAFLAFEPRLPYESIGIFVPALGAFGAALITASVCRGLHLALVSRRFSREWLGGATPRRVPGSDVPVLTVRSSFPLVAVIGLRRPQLVVADTVLDACSPEELRAILAHERGHIRRRDNLQRVLLGLVPDVLTWTPVAGRLFAEWRRAAELAADDDAARQHADARLHLASALVKVARLAVGASPRVPLPVSAFHGGDDLDRRVRRLLDPDAPASATRSGRSMTSAIAAIAFGAALASLESIHALLETAIHALP